MDRALAGLVCGCVFLGCAKSSHSQGTSEQQQEAFNKACVAVTAKPAGTMRGMADVIGASPSDCWMVPSLCICTWKFFTTQGPKKIMVWATFDDGLSSVENVTKMVDSKTRADITVPDDQVQQGFLSGKYMFRWRHQEVPVHCPIGATAQCDPDSTGTVEASEVEDAIKHGFVIITHEKLEEASRTVRYGKLSLSERLDQCIQSSGPTITYLLGDNEADAVQLGAQVSGGQPVTPGAPPLRGAP